KSIGFVLLVIGIIITMTTMSQNAYASLILDINEGQKLIDSGLYAHVRHPQYSGFVLIMFGFLLQWPTLLTLAMFPVLVWMYSRLSIHEERETEKAFGSDWRAYAARTPRFIPRLRNLRRKEIEEQE
ncbi:MAG: isoprenylcysteine carboxylmethyltransferase family protein, partial [Pseudomonas sp.]|nr:isoprenylcysteine carboxylmethyltransferase family protein [Pseudomonas sp.]